jgi:hypothetical protein
MLNTYRPIRRVVAEQADALGDLHIEGHEGRIPAGLIARPDEIAVLVDERIRQAGADVEDQEHRELLRQVKAMDRGSAPSPWPRYRMKS